MKAVQGIVSTHAQTIRPATPQRTAESLRVAPTPMIAPVMVWVVDTGIPSAVARNSVIAPPGLGAEPADGLQLGDLLPHRLDDPPAAEQRAQRDRGVAGEDDPERDVGTLEIRSERSVRDEDAAR